MRVHTYTEREKGRGRETGRDKYENRGVVGKKGVSSRGGGDRE